MDNLFKDAVGIFQAMIIGITDHISRILTLIFSREDMIWNH